MKRPTKFIIAKNIALAWVFMVVVYSSTFFLTSLVFKKVNFNPPGFISQLINIMVAWIVIFLIGSIFSAFARNRGWERQRGPLGPVIDAMERIAKGDFSVRVADYFQEDEPFGKLVESVNNMALELDAMEKLRQEFISNVSHEIQSPLTSIRGFSQALQNDRLSPEERAHYLAIIEDESTRLSRITENLLKLASLESDEVKFDPQPFRLDKQVRHLVLACEPRWTEKQIEVDADLQEITFNGDEDLLSQVWNNLIYNSIKFTPPGGKINVALKRQDGQVVFRICDTGVGIPPADLERIFERFYKADKSRTRSAEGSGLGLSIAQKIVQMHQGSIRVESQPEAGSTFVVTLPE